MALANGCRASQRSPSSSDSCCCWRHSISWFGKAETSGLWGVSRIAPKAARTVRSGVEWGWEALRGQRADDDQRMESGGEAFRGLDFYCFFSVFSLFVFCCHFPLSFFHLLFKSHSRLIHLILLFPQFIHIHSFPAIGRPWSIWGRFAAYSYENVGF